MSRHTGSDTAVIKTRKVTDIKSIPAKRLYRGVIDYARKLENGRQHRRNLMSVFQAEQTGLRQKLRDACEKLMFMHPLEYGKKAEELIWRKVYYEVIQLVKSNRKIVRPGSRLETLYKEYLSAAIGYYHHLMLKLQSKYQPDVHVDWPYASSPLSDRATRKHQILHEALEGKTDSESKEGKKRADKKDADKDSEPKLTVEQWALDMSYRILLCLGDLGRYRVELGGSRPFAERFYQLSLLVKPNIGLPFNQLGTLAGHHTWWGLTAAYYYYRCLETENKFEGADGNLQKLLDRNKKNFYQIPTDALENMISAEEYKKEHTRIFIISFLYLCDLLRPKTYATDVEITALCKRLIDALPVCLNNSSSPEDGNPDESYARGHRNSKSLKWNSSGFSHHHHHHHHPSSGDYTHLQTHVILKMCVLCIINIHSLQSSRSNRSSAAIAFALAFFSHLLGYVISQLDPEKINNSKTESETVNSNGMSEGGVADENGDGDASHAQSKNQLSAKKKKSRILRRRRHRGSGDSDLSEGESSSGSELSDSDSDSNNSDSSSTTSTNSELSQEGMDETILENSKMSPSKPEKGDESKKSVEQSAENKKTENIVDNHAGLELANSLANGQSTLASLKDISQRMFQPTVKRRILLAPSFFNNIPQKKPSNSQNQAIDKVASKPAESSNNDENSNKASEAQTKVDDHKADGDKEEVNAVDGKDKDTAEGCDQDKSEKEIEGVADGHTDENVSSTVFKKIGTLHHLFAALKLLCDWLDANEKVTAACAQNSKALWSRIAKLVNLLPNEEELGKLADFSPDDAYQEQLEISKSCVSSMSKNWKQLAKLPEDYVLSETTSSVQYKNDSDKAMKSLICDLTETQQIAIRVCRIRSFCHSLVGVEGLDMEYHKTTQKFEGPEEPAEEETEHLGIEAMEEMRKTRLMKDMAELRLRNEVTTLESQLGTPRARDASLCLYLVPDALALCHDLPHIKRLLSSEKYFIVIPKTVIDGLDGLKKDLQGARDAIRFLETEFKKGNRYIKSQMVEEASRGVPGERPKLRRNDMQAWRFYRIIECCRFIVDEKSKKGDNNDTSGLVAILTHSTDKSTLSQNQINAITAAESFGIQVFSAVQFSKLWKRLPVEDK